MKGIFVNNEDGIVRYADAIVEGFKTVETRNRNMLSACVGERVCIIATRRGKKPVVIGSVLITCAYKMCGGWMNEHRNLTLIPKYSKYDNNGEDKWCYFLADSVSFGTHSYPLPQNAVRHGRSWCEWEA